MPSVGATGTELFDAVGEAFVERCRQLNLAVLSVAADRHGSTVWEAVSGDPVPRYVTFALTDLGTTDPNGLQFLVEFWAGAPFETGYRRRMLHREVYKYTPDETDDIESQIYQGVAAALEAAHSLTEDSPSEAYPATRLGEAPASPGIWVGGFSAYDNSRAQMQNMEAPSSPDVGAFDIERLFRVSTQQMEVLFSQWRARQEDLIRAIEELRAESAHKNRAERRRKTRGS